MIVSCSGCDSDVRELNRVRGCVLAQITGFAAPRLAAFLLVTLVYITRRQAP